MTSRITSRTAWVEAGTRPAGIAEDGTPGGQHGFGGGASLRPPQNHSEVLTVGTELQHKKAVGFSPVSRGQMRGRMYGTVHLSAASRLNTCGATTIQWSDMT